MKKNKLPVEVKKYLERRFLCTPKVVATVENNKIVIRRVYEKD